ncbi:MAG: gliding motility-associated protein GldE [Sphingobacteriales bacterium]|nr:gliding motility-associated protein GldE [Sphingobacteriales bacterium]
MPVGFAPTILAIMNVQAITIMIVSIILLLAMSFCISGAEVAFFSLTYKDINMLKTKNHPSAKRILQLLDTPKTLLASMLIANSLINIAIILLTNFLIDGLIENSPQLYQVFWVSFLVKVVCVTFLLVLFGEVMPKVMATQHNLMFAYNPVILTAVEFFNYFFRRMSLWLVSYSDAIENKLGPKDAAAYSLEQIDHAIDLTVDEDTTQEEKNILKGIVKFGNITVKQIMKTRLDVSGIEFGLNFLLVKEKVEELHYSRLPVYHTTLDEIKGILHTKDLLPHLHEQLNFDWHTLIRQPCFVHEQKLIDDLLQEFQLKRIHFAIVVDEFGGTSGIVTLEDIMEEIIGDIKDEFDEEESGNKKIDDYNFLFEGKTMIHDVCKAMDIPLDTFDKVRGESDSLAGLVLEIAGEFPKNNEVIKSGDFDFTVIDISKNRIQKVKVTVHPPPLD